MTVALFPGAVKHTKLRSKGDTSTNVSCTSLSSKKLGKLYDRTEVKICKVFQRTTNEWISIKVFRSSGGAFVERSITHFPAPAPGPVPVPVPVPARIPLICLLPMMRPQSALCVDIDKLAGGAKCNQYPIFTCIPFHEAPMWLGEIEMQLQHKIDVNFARADNKTNWKENAPARGWEPGLR